MVARTLVLLSGLLAQGQAGCHGWLVQQRSAASIGCHCWLVQQCLFAQAAAEEPLWQRLPPERRAKVFAALAALVILGALMLVVAWLSARAMRRYMRGPRRTLASGTSERSDDDWWKKPLVENPLSAKPKEPPVD